MSKKSKEVLHEAVRDDVQVFLDKLSNVCHDAIEELKVAMKGNQANSTHTTDSLDHEKSKLILIASGLIKSVDALKAPKDL